MLPSLPIDPTLAGRVRNRSILVVSESWMQRFRKQTRKSELDLRDWGRSTPMLTSSTLIFTTSCLPSSGTAHNSVHLEPKNLNCREPCFSPFSPVAANSHPFNYSILLHDPDWVVIVSSINSPSILFFSNVSFYATFQRMCQLRFWLIINAEWLCWCQGLRNRLSHAVEWDPESIICNRGFSAE